MKKQIFYGVILGLVVLLAVGVSYSLKLTTAGVSADFDYSNLMATENMNSLYYKAIVPDDTGNQWNLSVQFAETKPVVFLGPDENSLLRYSVRRSGNIVDYYAWVCCNVTKSDRLYTADATNDSSLRGTLTNLYNINYKSRFPYDNGTFRNTFVGAATKPDVYNRRAKLSLDGTQVAYAMETRNVSIPGVPELMRVYLV